MTFGQEPAGEVGSHTEKSAGQREESGVPQVEIRQRARRLETFMSDVDPEDEVACVALLRKRAAELRKPAAELELRVKDRRKRTRTYKAS
jgi:hypothetical protein